MSDIRQWAHDRREELRRERALGEAQLRELEAQVVGLQRLLLQVGGGIRILDELLAETIETSVEPPATPAADATGTSIRVG